ncbi:MAG TPA: bacteriohopanetetrol glucosamine biosynthesis glycosyltransferase HpnI [Terriglobales bacterium]|nr:bacteriohopanetetrol glucosamine biosynthesis glycosyltransferase HpnI [Terriglobales bacterium]
MVFGLSLFVALAGLVSCTGFLVLVVISAVRFHGQRGPRLASVPQLPSVSLLKPLCGLEPNLKSNLESFFQQDYPDFEIIFGARHADDPALAVVSSLQQRYPGVPVRIVLSGEPDRPNAKVCSLQKMCAVARTDYFVISDSDVHVSPTYLRDVVPPLLDDKVGLVTCLYRGMPTGGVWSHLEALGMSVEMTSGAIVANMLEGMRFALGPTMAVKRKAVDAIGGMGRLADYCADDYVLGRLVYESGYRVVLSQHIIDHVVLNRSCKDSILHQIRWMKSTRFSRPKGHIGTVLTFAMPFGLIGMAAGFAAGRPGLGLGLLAWAALNRIIISLAAGWRVVRDHRAVRYAWSYPIRDLMGFCFWCASFLGTTIVWRKERYRLLYGGKMIRLSGATPAQTTSGTVAVDNLA